MEQSITLPNEYQPSDQQRTQTEDLNLEKQHPPRTSARWNSRIKYLSLGVGRLLATLPQYIQPGGLRWRKKKLTPSSYLDALRGYAALFVINRHIFKDLAGTWFFQLPFIRVTHNGEGMVDLFFVISGYVLSYRLLVSIRNQDTGRMLESLASATFRRYLRLYGSAGVAMFISMLLVWLGWIDIPWPIKIERKDFMGQLYDWAQDVGAFSNPFVALEGYWYEGVFSARYLYPTWTIPIEFRGSMMVFVFCTAVCKLSTTHRMVLSWAMIILCYYWQAIYAALFLFGMFIADVSLGRNPQRLAVPVQLPQHNIESQRSQPIAARIAYVILLIIALFLLGGQPRDHVGPFPWPYLSAAIPKYGTDLELYFWPSIGAFLLVLTLESCPALQKPLTCNFSLYLGDISFGIYVMHQIVAWGLSGWLLDPSREKYLGNSKWAEGLGIVIYLLVVLWAAEWFGRLDARVVRMGRLLEKAVFLKWEG